MSAKETIVEAITRTAANRKHRLPVALLSGGTWTFRQRGYSLRDILDIPEKAAEMIVEINQDVQSDIVWPGSGYHNLLVHVFGGKVKFRHQGNIDVQQPLFEKIIDIDKLQLDDLDRHEWIAAIRSIIGNVAAKTGQQYLVGTSSWGPFTLAGQFYGVEKLMIGVYKDKQSIHALLEVMTDLCVRYLAPAVRQGAEIVSIAEPTASGDLISLRHFEEFVAPYITKAISRLKEHNALITLHICGNIKDRIQLVPQMAVDLLSVDYKVDLQQAQQKLNGKVALAGNVNPLVLKDQTPREILLAAESCSRQLDPDHFVLMPGCDIPPAVPYDNVKAFIAAGHQWSQTNSISYAG